MEVEMRIANEEDVPSILRLYAVAICRKHQCYKVALSANLKRKRAHVFYESLGFRIHGYSYSIVNP